VYGSRLPLLLAALCLALSAGAGRAEPAARLVLSPQEKAYVAAHPTLTAAMVDVSIPPLQSWDAEGRPDGIVAEYFALIEQRTGLRIQVLRAASIVARDADFGARRADLLPLVLAGDPVARMALTTAPFLQATPVYVTRRDTADFSPTGNLGGLRVAVTPGGAFEQFLRRRFPDAPLVLTTTPLDELRAVSEGRADVRIGMLPTTVHAIESQLLANLSVRAYADGAPQSYSMGVQADQPVLHGLLSRTLASITPAEHQAILAKWVPVRHFLAIDAQALLLTEAERAWVRQHPRIRVAYDRAFTPYSFEHDRTMQGLGPDLLRKAAQQVGLEIAEERPGTWAQAFEDLVAGKADMLVAAGRNDERRRLLQFIGPWSSSPTAIVTRGLRNAGPYELGDLLGAPLAVQERHFLIPHLQRKYPGLRLLHKPTLQEALQAVRDGTAEAAIGNLQVVADMIRRDHPGTLTVSGGVVDGDSELFFALRQDQPELAVVLRKGLEAISEAERSQLRQRWLVVSYAPGWSMREVLLVFGPALAVALVALWVVRRGNRRLQAEARQRQQAQQQLHEALQREQALSAGKTRFIGALSHEIRNPMAAMVGAAGLLRGEVSGDTARRLVAGIEHAGDGLLELLSRTLDFSKAEGGMLSMRSEWVNPADWCRRLCDAYVAPALAKGLRVETRLHGPPGLQAEFDPVRLGQVLSNLLSNALKFSDAGAVTVELWQDAERAQLRVAVQDTGVGIPEAELPQLFQPYSQLPSTRSRHAEGSGLGLALCREIVQHMGGRIDVSSQPGQGSRFTVEVPVAWRPAPSPAPASLPAAAKAESGTAGSVLVVDDDPVGLLITSEQLRRMGFEVATADGGEAALALWQGSAFALVLTDCHMPGIDGFELARQIRQTEAGRHTRIVALTGSTDAEEHARCRACGIDAVLVKPAEPAALQASLRAA
jgi:two-component system, NarL family, sensor histidine kinase EvgS